MLYVFAYCHAHLGDQRKAFKVWQILSKMKNALRKKKKTKLKQELKAESKLKKTKSNATYPHSFMDFQL